MKTRRAWIGAPLGLIAGFLLAAGTVAGSPAQAVRAGFVYRPPPASLDPKPAATIAPGRLPALRFVAPPDTTYRDAKAAMADADLLAPCMLYTKNLPSGRQFQALGAPLFPWRSDAPGTRLQARFPLVSLAF